MKDNFDLCLTHLLAHEGGFVNNAHDPGGMTNLGVTRKTWQEWIGKPASESDMRALTPELVAPLYKKRYWMACGADVLQSGLDNCVFDCAVNSGPAFAVKILQRIIGVADDGVVGRDTAKRVNSLPTAELVDRYCATRLAFMQKLPTFNVFGKGWTKRVNAVKAESKAMVVPFV